MKIKKIDKHVTIIEFRKQLYRYSYIYITSVFVCEYDIKNHVIKHAEICISILYSNSANTAILPQTDEYYAIKFIW